MFGDSVSAKAKDNVFTAITRINARVAFTVFSSRDLLLGQGAFFGTAGWRIFCFGVISPTL
jgi:hypothetical protein